MSVRQPLLFFLQLFLDVLRDLHGVAARLLVNLEENGVVAVGGDTDPLRLGGELRPSRRLPAERRRWCPSATTVCGDFSDIREPGVGDDQIKFVVIFDPTDSDEDVGRGKRFGDIAQAHVEGLQFRRIDDTRYSSIAPPCTPTCATPLTSESAGRS